VSSEPSRSPHVPDGLVKSISRLFEAASVHVIDQTQKPLFRSEKRETASAAKVKEFFGFRAEYSNWTNNHLIADSPDSQLRRTQKLLRILSGDYLRDMPEKHRDLYKRVFECWRHTKGESLSWILESLRKYETELAAYSLGRKRRSIEEQQDILSKLEEQPGAQVDLNATREIRIFLDEPPVGRDEVLAEALFFLESGRGLIISGAPGQGKTMFARHIALTAAERFASKDFFTTGVFEIDLESELEIDSLPKAIASVLGEASAPSSFDFLKSRSCLLLLDGADNLVRATEPHVLAREIGRVSESLALGSRIIITCQKKFLKAQGGFRTIELEPLNPEAAVQLFHSLSDHRYAYHSKDDISEFVNAALAGHPLSIRIVAGFGSAVNLAFSELVRLWHDQWGALDAAQFAIDERGLRASFELTYGGLATSAKFAFLLLSLFPDGITLALTRELWPDGYERVYGDLITLSGLSLLEKRPSRKARATQADENLDILGRLRGPLFQFSRSKWLEEDICEAKLYGRSLHDLMAATDKYFDAYVRSNAPQYADPDPGPKSELIRHQFHNIHASLDRRLEPAEAEESIGAANSVLSLYWAYHNNLSGANSPVSSTREATSYLKKANDVFSANGLAAQSRRCIYYIGNILWLRGDISDAKRFLQDVLESEDADEKMLCDTQRAFAHIEYKEGSIPLSVANYMEVMTKAESFGYEECSIKCRVGLIDAYRKLAEYKSAIEIYFSMEGKLDAYEREKSNAIRGYAYVLSLMGELSEARTQYWRAIEHFNSNAFGLAHCYRGLGDVSVREGELDAAGDFFESALVYYSDARKNRSLGVGLVFLGQARLALARADCGSALEIARNAAELFDRQQLNEPYELASAYELIGDIHNQAGRKDQARASYELAIQRYRRVGASGIASIVEERKAMTSTPQK
jgi:tetratricopeptide (TPR) repeat protein